MKQYTLIKKEIKFSSYIRKFRWYMRKGFLIYKEMRKYMRRPHYFFTLREALSQYMTLQPLNFLIYEENFIFFFIMHKNIDGIYCLLPNLSYSLISNGAFLSVQCITNFT
jgi:hypothetical protein